MNKFDLLVVGAGPAGMAAAMVARRHGQEVLVVDDQPSPGGQIWRSVELSESRDKILGRSYVEGRAVAQAFRESGCHYDPGAQLWQLESGFRALVSNDGHARAIEASAVVLATGAQERPVPFPGWTLPGVMTVGAAQILLKSAGQVPVGPLWIAGCGPLPLLYMIQFLAAGGQIAGYLDTTPHGQWRAALRSLPRALRASGDLAKGLRWAAKLRLSQASIIRDVSEIAAIGRDNVERLSYRTAGGKRATVECAALLVHEGVVPNIHPALSVGCNVEWSPDQDCFVPVTDSWGESSVPNVYIAGDGAGIAGAKAAQLRGELAGLRVAVKSGALSSDIAATAARKLHRKLDRELAVRPFLDALFRPRSAVFAPDDETIVCRCEGVTAGQIRSAAGIGRPGPNQVKAATRVGMGPCQGRQCGITVSRILSSVQNRTPQETGFFHIRPPLKPVSLREIALVETE